MFTHLVYDWTAKVAVGDAFPLGATFLLGAIAAEVLEPNLFGHDDDDCLRCHNVTTGNTMNDLTITIMIVTMFIAKRATILDATLTKQATPMCCHSES